MGRNTKYTQSAVHNAKNSHNIFVNKASTCGRLDRQYTSGQLARVAVRVETRNAAPLATTPHFCNTRRNSLPKNIPFGTFALKMRLLTTAFPLRMLSFTLIILFTQSQIYLNAYLTLTIQIDNSGILRNNFLLICK